MPEYEDMKELEAFLDAKLRAATKIIPLGKPVVVGAWNEFMWTVPALVSAVRKLEMMYKSEIMRRRHEQKTKGI